MIKVNIEKREYCISSWCHIKPHIPVAACIEHGTIYKFRHMYKDWGRRQIIYESSKRT